MIFGSLAVFSSIAFFAESHGRSAADLAVRHVIKMGIALCVMLFISKINYNVLARFSRLAILLSWMLLFAVLIYRKSTRLNSSHVAISYAVFCFKKKSRREQ